MRVLITAGGTEEPLDGVRCLSNRSTGATGLALASYFSDKGAEVVLLHAERVARGDLPVETVSFVTFDDLSAALHHLLADRHFDAVIHLAAVSDYRLAAIEVDGETRAPGTQGKIGSGHQLLLRLQPNPKLIDRLHGWSLDPGLTVVGFKLTDHPDPAVREQRVGALLERGSADLVVLNDIREIDGRRHLAAIYSGRGLVARTRNKNELAAVLYDLLADGESS